MKKTTKILSLIVVIAMMAAMFATGASAATYTVGQVLYENDFSNFDVSTLKAEGYAVASGAHKTLEIKDGALHMVGEEWNADKSLKIGGRFGTRINLYDIPEDVDRYSITADVYINEYLASSSSAGPSILLTNNGIYDADGKATKGEFAMMWLRKAEVGTTGYYQYGETASNVVDKNQPGFCDAGTWYTVQFYVDLGHKDGPTGMFKIINKTTGYTYEAEEVIFNTLGHNNVVGVYNNVTDVLFDNIKVTYGDAYFGNDKLPTPEETTKAPTADTTKAPTADTTKAPTEDTTGTVTPAPTGDMGTFVWVALAAIAAMAIAGTTLKIKAT